MYGVLVVVGAAILFAGGSALMMLANSNFFGYMGKGLSAVGGAVLDAEGALVGGLVGADRQGEVRLQEDATIMPVEPGGEVDPR